LIIDFVPTQPNQLWVSDITYWKIGDKNFYISLITDAFSRKIVGYHLSDNLHAEQTTKALKMALREIEDSSQSHFQLIHHSDRGVQYCSSSYINQLKKKNIDISMTQSGDPLENAIAERVNGIIKDEYLLNYQCNNIINARKQLALAVSLYNKERPHNSIGNLTPEFVHNQYHQIEKEKIKKLWKNYYTKKTIFVNLNQD
jgi:transposase InsO family protein